MSQRSGIQEKKKGKAVRFQKTSLYGSLWNSNVSRRSFVSFLSLFGMGLLFLSAGTSCNRPLSKPGRIPKKNSRKGSLIEKALFFDQEIGKWHLTSEGLLAYEIFWPPPKGKMVPTSFADMAIWTGCYLGAESFRYAVTGDLEAKKRVDQCVEGLGLTQEVTGVPGLIARSVRKRFKDSSNPMAPEGPNLYLPSIHEKWRVGEGAFSDYEWLGDVSSDQLDGVVFGEGIAFDVGPHREHFFFHSMAQTNPRWNNPPLPPNEEARYLLRPPPRIFDTRQPARSRLREEPRWDSLFFLVKADPTHSPIPPVSLTQTLHPVTSIIHQGLKIVPAAIVWF